MDRRGNRLLLTPTTPPMCLLNDYIIAEMPLPVQPVVEEVLPNPPPDQPEWVGLTCRCVALSPNTFKSFHPFFQIKALISAPPTEPAPPDAKKTEEPVAAPAAEPPTIAPRPKPANKANNAKALGLLGKRAFEK